ncbi:MarR family winged helix-turn-helix transcriptional regulator [Roseibacillus ishigakijimensis]|uniref:Winged helix DNA-binding protein n=1 Tax=Roseibacillus ishigakijimensis TaxID=454146 RepID=A0A934RNI3_9BACT|nr:winged helix DNA-binding protein [Roseibacillus ishigakijimensis]MBK1832573.1 winged helix DNA-binding protein [Roseibacillus ishigakijimensis]
MKRPDQAALKLRELIAETEIRLAAQERRLLASFEIGPSDLAILSRLRRKGPKPVNQIADKVGLTSGSMTTAIQRLRHQKLVETQPDEEDRRRLQVALTPKGERLLGAASASRDELFATLFRDLSYRESDLLGTLLKKVRKASRP